VHDFDHGRIAGEARQVRGAQRGEHALAQRQRRASRDEDSQRGSEPIHREARQAVRLAVDQPHRVGRGAGPEQRAAPRDRARHPLLDAGDLARPRARRPQHRREIARALGAREAVRAAVLVGERHQRARREAIARLGLEVRDHPGMAALERARGAAGDAERALGRRRRGREHRLLGKAQRLAAAREAQAPGDEDAAVHDVAEQRRAGRREPRAHALEVGAREREPQPRHAAPLFERLEGEALAAPFPPRRRGRERLAALAAGQREPRRARVELEQRAGRHLRVGLVEARLGLAAP